MATPESPLDAGAIVVRYRLDKDQASFARYRKDLAAIVTETEAADKKMVLHPRIDRTATRQFVDDFGNAMDGTERRYDRTRDHFARNPVKPEIDGRSLARYEATLTKMQRAAQVSNRRINQFLKFSVYGGGTIAAGLGAAFVGAGVEYAKFEDQMYKVQAISGATAKQMDLLRKSAKELATEGRYSQQELGAAQVELVKGGMEAADLYGGGLRTAYLLASAGQIELADAAAYTVNAMNLFNIEAKDSMLVADAFAAAANLTTASVEDFGMALAQGGSNAKSAGLDFQDTMTWLAALAKRGIKNSDAGTSIKSAIMQATSGLSPRARQIMKLIGMDLYNTKGELKDINALTKELVDSVGKYDRETQGIILGQIFGSDGVRAALALIDNGVSGVKELDEGVAKQGESARVTSIQNQGLAFAWLQLKNTLGVVAAEGFAPFDKNVTEAFKNLQGWLKSTAPALRDFSERINKILDADMPWREKVAEIWDELANSDVAEGLKAAVVTALSFVPDLIVKAAATAFDVLPKILVAAFMNSSALGKVALTTLLLAKFGPAIGAVGKALGGVFSKIPGVGGLLDKLFGGRGTTMANPLYVWMVNGGLGIDGPGGPGGRGRKGPRGGPGRGVPGDRAPGLPRTAPKGGPGVLGRVTQWGGKALPWLAGIPMAGIAANPITLGIVASVLGGGALAWGLSGQGPLSKKADPRAGKRFGAQMWKQKARNFFSEREDLLQGDPRTRGKRIKSAMKEELKNVPEQFRAAWAQGAIIWAKEMEGAKRLSRGTAADIRAHLVGSMKVISRQSAKAAWNYRAAIGGMNMTTIALIGNAKRAGVSIDKVARAAQRARSQAGKALNQTAPVVKGFFASGGYVDGPRTQGVPVVLHGDEAVLNSQQMDMIGRDRIMAVLGSTGAQTISAGGSYARGGKPKEAPGAGAERATGRLADATYGVSTEEKERRARAKRKAQEASRRRRTARENPTVPGYPEFERRERELLTKQAIAEGTTDYDEKTTKDLRDDLRAARALERLYGQRRKRLDGMKGKYKRKGKGAWPQMRTAIEEEFLSVVGLHNRASADVKDLESQINPKKDPNEEAIVAPQDVQIESLTQSIDIREARRGAPMTEGERQTIWGLLNEKLTWLEGKLKSAVGPKFAELRSKISSEISETAGEMKRLDGELKSSTATPMVNPAAQFAAARQDLYREFGSNSRALPVGGAFAGFGAGLAGSGGGMRGGTMVTQNITIAEPPVNAHAFAQKLAWETRAAL